MALHDMCYVETAVSAVVTAVGQLQQPLGSYNGRRTYLRYRRQPFILSWHDLPTSLARWNRHRTHRVLNLLYLPITGTHQCVILLIEPLPSLATKSLCSAVVGHMRDSTCITSPLTNKILLVSRPLPPQLVRHAIQIPYKAAHSLPHQRHATAMTKQGELHDQAGMNDNLMEAASPHGYLPRRVTYEAGSFCRWPTIPG